MHLDENDHLTFQLYTASKSARVRNGRLRSWAMTTTLMVLLAFLFNRSGNSLLTTYFMVAAGLCLIFFPFYSRWRYKMHYLKHIREIYKDKYDEDCDIEFTGDSIVTRDPSGENKIRKTEIIEINEIADHYFLRVRGGKNLIISKSKSDDIEKIRKGLAALVEKYGVKHNVELKWKWK